MPHVELTQVVGLHLINTHISEQEAQLSHLGRIGPRSGDTQLILSLQRCGQRHLDIIGCIRTGNRHIPVAGHSVREAVKHGHLHRHIIEENFRVDQTRVSSQGEGITRYRLKVIEKRECLGRIYDKTVIIVFSVGKEIARKHHQRQTK